MFRLHTLLCVVFAFEMSLHPASARSTYTMTELGTLGGKATTAHAINDRGQIVGYSDTATIYEDGFTQYHAFLWRSGQMTDIGVDPKYPNTDATSINNGGQVLVNTETRWQRGQGGASPSALFGVAYLWEDGKAKPLLDPPKPSLGAFGSRFDGFQQFVVGEINDAGTVVNNDFVALNNKGQKVENVFTGQKEIAPHVLRQFLMATLFNGVRKTSLGTLGGPSSVALGMNDAAEVVGWSHTKQDKGHAFVWAKGKMRDLGVPPDYETSQAVSINNHDEVVGSASTSTSRGHAILWQSGFIYDLNGLVQTAPNVVLEEAVDINNEGQILCNGTLHGERRAFLLTPQK